MGALTRLKHIKTKEYKVLYQRIFFTLMMIVIYIIGSHITLPGIKVRTRVPHSFLDIALSNVGGDIGTINLFSLGLGPWLTTMMIMALLTYRNIEKEKLETQLERHFKERFFTLLLAIIQGYFVLSPNQSKFQGVHIGFLLLIIVTGAMVLVWLADQNTVYGIAGPTPIVLVGMIKSIFQHQQLQHIGVVTVAIGIALMLIVLVLLVWIERIEYRINYQDVMNVTTSQKDTYISWKLNPAGSIAMMCSFSLFFIVGMLAHVIGRWLTGDASYQPVFLELNHSVGVLMFLVMLIMLNFMLSKVLLNPKRKAKEFQKSGHYIDGIYPGKATRVYLNRKSNQMSAIGAAVLGLIMSLPLQTAIVVNDMTQELSVLIQFVILIYMTINITETVRTYLYFDQYQSFLDSYSKE
ncbi:accessory Sec system protein translocase subunit SecY2 [Staphylococcus ursi]|uniref:accessory Sec system protein translocase subunit SecY2 n=1 Tax=Staphylococcus sp. MI 10-1553 TaxID=1912064 RepID=UPI00139975C3|nr:accessory Sec system protein translocase subunit SecY2 [Staphylococcus sp. MI 10-1553]QHW35947.1 accessory Sec system protein translocase subunit SecY2 [Staphylococcus sp. MI 10-1553]